MGEIGTAFVEVLASIAVLVLGAIWMQLIEMGRQIATLSQWKNKIDQQSDDHEKRLRVVEHRKYR